MDWGEYNLSADTERLFAWVGSGVLLGPLHLVFRFSPSLNALEGG